MTENFFADKQIWLEDRANVTMTNLLAAPAYTFNQTAEINDSRFFLHFGMNHAPILAGTMFDKLVLGGETLAFSVPENLFTDEDLGDIISLSATAASRSELPGWLNFDATTGIFTGTAPASGTYTFKITATDLLGATAETTFTLTVNTTGVEELEINNITISPNPSKGIINIYIPETKDAEITIYSISGKKVMTILPTSDNQQIDMSAFSSGIYILKYKSDTQTAQKKFVIK